MSAQERTTIQREVCEVALARTIKDEAEVVCARSDLFEKRRDVMERWARFLDPRSARVVPLREAVA